MKKKRGSYMLELFNRYGQRKKTKIVKNYMEGKAKAEKHEAKHPRNSAVLLRVLYNTFDNADAWDVK